MRAAAAVLLLLAVVAPAAAQPTPPVLRVTYRSESSVYVGGGRAQGLAVGERLTVVDGRETVGELEVMFVAENSASCRVVRQSRPLRVGDTVRRAAGAPPPAAAPTPVPSTPVEVDGADRPRPAPSPRPSVPPASRPFALATGSLSAGFATSFGADGDERTTSEQYGRFDVSLRDLGGRAAASFRSRGSTRNVSRSGPGFAVPLDERRDRLYEAALSWRPPQGRLSAQVGRLGASPFVSLGYLDGIFAEARPTGVLHVGGFFGRDPNVENVPAYDGGSRMGGFVRLVPAPGRVPWELVLSGVRENAADEVSREYVGVQGQARAGRLWLHAFSEIDLNRGWRQERAASSTQLSSLRLGAAWRLSATRSFSVSYDRHETYLSRANRGLPDSLLDPAARQGVRATFNHTPAQGAGVWAGGNVRLREGEDRSSWAVFAGVRHPRLFGMMAGVEATYSQSVFSQGVQGTARLGRELRGGHRLDLSYTMNRFDPVVGDDTRTTQWLRLSGYGQLGRRAFAQADVEYAAGDDFEGPRVLAEAGWRF